MDIKPYRNDVILALRNGGSNNDIAQKLGCSYGYVANIRYQLRNDLPLLGMGVSRRIDYAVVKKMLADNVAHAQIARTVHCSRERIRQLDMRWNGLTGRARGDHRFRTQPAALPEHPFIEEAIRRGMTVEPVFRKNGGVFERRILVNGHRVYLHYDVSMSRCGSTNGHIYYRVLASRIAADFYVNVMPGARTYMILPASKRPTGPTAISLEAYNPGKPGAHSYRHDYLDYVEAWHLLATPTTAPNGWRLMDRFRDLDKQLHKLKLNESLSVECDHRREAIAVQAMVDQFDSERLYGSRWISQRRGSQIDKPIIVYINRSQPNGEHHGEEKLSQRKSRAAVAPGH